MDAITLSLSEAEALVTVIGTALQDGTCAAVGATRLTEIQDRLRSSLRAREFQVAA